MSTSLSLNSRDTVGVTAFYGGIARGRCYTFHFEFINGIRINVELTEEQLFETLLNSRGIVTADSFSKISYDNRTVMDSLDEEEEIAKRSDQTIPQSLVRDLINEPEFTDIGKVVDVGGKVGYLGRDHALGWFLHTSIGGNDGFRMFLKDTDVVKFLIKGTTPAKDSLDDPELQKILDEEEEIARRHQNRAQTGDV